MQFRKATISDALILFEWANDSLSRSNSFNSQLISFEDHIQWLTTKLEEKENEILIFSVEGKEIGVVRLEVSKENPENAVISIIVSPDARGKSYSFKMLRLAADQWKSRNSDGQIQAYIKKDNHASYKAFLKAGFGSEKEIDVKGIPSLVMFY